MNESHNERKYYRVKAPIAQIRQLNAEEIAGVPHSVIRDSKEAIDAGYLYYRNQVPLWAELQQISHNLACNLICEVSKEEYYRLPAPGTPTEYVPTQADHTQRQREIAESYAH